MLVVPSLQLSSSVLWSPTRQNVQEDSHMFERSHLLMFLWVSLRLSALLPVVPCQCLSVFNFNHLSHAGLLLSDILGGPETAVWQNVITTFEKLLAVKSKGKSEPTLKAQGKAQRKTTKLLPNPLNM